MKALRANCNLFLFFLLQNRASDTYIMTLHNFSLERKNILSEEIELPCSNDVQMSKSGNWWDRSTILWNLLTCKVNHKYPSRKFVWEPSATRENRYFIKSSITIHRVHIFYSIYHTQRHVDTCARLKFIWLTKRCYLVAYFIHSFPMIRLFLSIPF